MASLPLSHRGSPLSSTCRKLTVSLPSGPSAAPPDSMHVGSFGESCREFLVSPLQVKLSNEEWWEASLQSPRLPEIDSGGRGARVRWRSTGRSDADFVAVLIVMGMLSSHVDGADGLPPRPTLPRTHTGRPLGEAGPWESGARSPAYLNSGRGCQKPILTPGINGHHQDTLPATVHRKWPS